MPLMFPELDAPVCTAKELESVFGPALTLAALSDIGTARRLVNTWVGTLAPRLVDRHLGVVARLEPGPDLVQAAARGKSVEFDTRVAALRSRVDAFRTMAVDTDVEATSGLTLVSRQALAFVRERSRAPEPRGGGLSALYQQVTSLLAGAEDERSDLTTLPEGLRQGVAAAAEHALSAELFSALADDGEARIQAAEEALRGRIQATETARRVQERLFQEAADDARTLPVRESVAAFDLEADGDIALARLLEGARRPDLDVLADRRLDVHVAEQDLRLAVADEVKRLAQRPANVLLPELFGVRSLRDLLDAFVRNSAPLAGFDRRELSDRAAHDGVTIAVVEARDPVVRRRLVEALERVGDVAVQEVDERLPPELVARVVRYVGLLPAETFVGSILDLMIAAGSPDEVGKGASRDWIEDLPELVGDERLREEIARRKRRKEPTGALEAWLGARSAEAMAAK